jgi:hypothetical protein
MSGFIDITHIKKESDELLTGIKKAGLGEKFIKKLEKSDLPELEYELIKSYLRDSTLNDYTSSNTQINSNEDISDILHKSIYEAELIHTSMRRHCWILSIDALHKICTYFNIEYHIDKTMTLMGYKVRCSSLLPENTIIFGEFLWGDEDDK